VARWLTRRFTETLTGKSLTRQIAGCAFVEGSRTLSYRPVRGSVKHWTAGAADPKPQLGAHESLPLIHMPG
jgi:hypothetical protein